MDPTIQPWDTLAEIPCNTVERVEAMGYLALASQLHISQPQDRQVWCNHHARVERLVLPLSRLLDVALTENKQKVTALVGTRWDLEQSYTCHSAECINPTHIALETREINGERNHCIKPCAAQVRALPPKMSTNDRRKAITRICKAARDRYPHEPRCFPTYHRFRASDEEIIAYKVCILIQMSLGY
jgi:hypothetical protein